MSKGIEALRDKYKYFGQYLEGKDINDYEQLLWAYKFEIKNYTYTESINIELADEFIDKDASGVLFLIRDIINSRKAEATRIYIGALISISEASNWKELKDYFISYKSYVSNLSLNSFIKRPDEQITIVASAQQLDNSQKVIFTKFLLLSLVRYVCQNRKAPPLYRTVIKGGILENVTETITERNYYRYKDTIDPNNPNLRKLLRVLDDFKDSIKGLMNIINAYRIKFGSTHIKNLSHSDNIAIKVPQYKNVDYDAILVQANKNLSSLNRQNAVKKVSMDKIVLFLFLVKYFNDPYLYSRINISTHKYSKFIGDSKVVSSIRDAFVKEDIFTNKIASLVEARPNSYQVQISFQIDALYPLIDSCMLMKLNNNQIIKSKGDLEYKLSLLKMVASAIKENRSGRKNNMTQAFLTSGKTFPLLYLLEIVNTLKCRITLSKNKFPDKDLTNVINKIDEQEINELYLKLYNRLSYHLNSNRIRLNFNVPVLHSIEDEDVKKLVKRKFKKSYLKDPDTKNIEEAQIKKKLIESRNNDFKLRLQNI